MCEESRGSTPKTGIQGPDWWVRLPQRPGVVRPPRTEKDSVTLGGRGWSKNDEGSASTRSPKRSEIGREP